MDIHKSQSMLLDKIEFFFAFHCSPNFEYINYKHLKTNENFDLYVVCINNKICQGVIYKLDDISAVCLKKCQARSERWPEKLARNYIV